MRIDNRAELSPEQVVIAALAIRLLGDAVEGVVGYSDERAVRLTVLGRIYRVTPQGYVEESDGTFLRGSDTAHLMQVLMMRALARETDSVADPEN